MVEVSIETLLVAMPPAPSVVVLRPANSEGDFANNNASGEKGEAERPETAAQPEVSPAEISKNPASSVNLALGTKHVLPIWIGPSEAASIGVALEHHAQPRPMTHDLLANTIYALGGKVERVVIDRVDGSTFFATVYINKDGRVLNIDARPSDSIALAVRTKAPLFVDEDVMNAASHRFLHQKGNVFEGVEESEDTMEEFRDFLDSITPEDFTVEQ